MAGEQARDPLSYLWAPLCAVGSHGERPNAQICVAVFGASIVPDRPRVLVGLWKENHTHDLVARAGTLAVTLLSAEQSTLLAPLGLRSGRERDKLEGIEHRLTRAGDPYLPGGTGYLAGEVIESFDWGDATGYLVAVRERARLTADEPLFWRDAAPLLPGSFVSTFQEKSARDQAAARRVMIWRDG